MITKDLLIKCISTAEIDIDIATVSTDKELDAIGMDSLDVFSFLTEVEKVTGKSIPDEDVESVTTIDALYEYLINKEE